MDQLPTLKREVLKFSRLEEDIEMNKEKMKRILQKNQYHFLVQKKQDINHMLKILMYLSTGEKKENYDKLYSFYHSLKGTAGTLGLQELFYLGEEMESFMEDGGYESITSSENIVHILRNLAKIEKQVEDALGKTSYNNMEEFKDTFSGKDPTKLSYTGRIMVIDDDSEMLSFLESILSNDGYEVLISSNPEEAMIDLKTEPIDLALVDVLMPGKSGFDIYNYIIKEKINIPIIFLTGLEDTKVKWRALREGVDDFLKKPFEPEALLSRVEGILKKKNKKEMDFITDELTGAYTRKFFSKRFEEEKQRHKRNSKSMSIAFLDIDYFKEINDTYGHIFGDKVLKGFVETIKSVLREYDQIFRYGGDEFILLLPETTGQEAFNVVERIRQAIQKKSFISDEKKRVC